MLSPAILLTLLSPLASSQSLGKVTLYTNPNCAGTALAQSTLGLNDQSCTVTKNSALAQSYKLAGTAPNGALFFPAYENDGKNGHPNKPNTCGVYDPARGQPQLDGCYNMKASVVGMWQAAFAIDWPACQGPRKTEAGCAGGSGTGSKVKAGGNRKDRPPSRLTREGKKAEAKARHGRQRPPMDLVDLDAEEAQQED